MADDDVERNIDDGEVPFRLGRRRIIVWAAGVAVLGFVAMAVVDRQGYEPPGFIVHDPIDTSPSMGRGLWLWLWLSILWTVVNVLALAVANHRALPSGIAATFACVALPIVWVAGAGAWSTAHAGCGTPYEELLQPLPSDIRVVDESVYFDSIGGAGRSRTLELVDAASGDPAPLATVMPAMNDLGWEVKTGFDDFATSQPSVAEWQVTVLVTDTTTSLTLTHWPPDGDAGCFRL